MSSLYGTQCVIRRQRILEDGEEYDDSQGTQENEDGTLGLLRNLLVECGSTTTIDIFALGGILKFSLELRVFVEVETTMI